MFVKVTHYKWDVDNRFAMRLGDQITTRINQCEAWIKNRPRPLLLCPLRLLAAIGLFLLLLVSNLLAVARWPFSAAARLARFGGATASGEPIPADATKLEQLICGDVPVLIDFWAEWCGPCLLMNGVLKDVAKTLEGKVVVAKVDATLHPILTKQYQVGGLPTLVLVKNGNEVARSVGARGVEDLLRFVAASLDYQHES